MEEQGMELRTLRYFLAVCEAGSMSRAAERLHVTQPTLSRQVAELERELGCELLVRHSRSVEPTEEGLHLIGRATDIVALADLTEGEYKRAGEVVAGDVRIACGETHGMETLAQVARRFRARHPQVRFCLHSGNAAYVLERLERGLDDFAVLIGYPSLGRYEHVRLPHVDAWGVYVREDDPLAEKGAVLPADLVGVPLIASEQASEHDELSSWFGGYLREIEFASTYTLCYNGLMLTRAGMGPTLGLESLTATGPGTGLEFRPLTPPVVSHVDVCWRRNWRPTNACRLFADELRSTYERQAR
jgi:DNA-binding transcriptional LysR family regulator